MPTRAVSKSLTRSAEQKRAIALESLDASTTPTDVARRYGISSGLLYTWRRQLREGQLGSAPQRLPRFARVDLVGEAPRLAAPELEPAPPLSDPPPPAPVLQPPPASTPSCAGLIEITLPGGASVRVDGSVDGAALRRVLDVLEGQGRRMKFTDNLLSDFCAGACSLDGSRFQHCSRIGER